MRFVLKPQADIAARIRVRREEVGLTQGELAARLGAPGGQGQVSRWERGKEFPSLESLEKVARALEIEPEEFLEMRHTTTKAVIGSMRLADGKPMPIFEAPTRGVGPDELLVGEQYLDDPPRADMRKAVRDPDSYREGWRDGISAGIRALTNTLVPDVVTLDSPPENSPSGSNEGGPPAGERAPGSKAGERDAHHEEHSRRRAGGKPPQEKRG